MITIDSRCCLCLLACLTLVSCSGSKDKEKNETKPDATVDSGADPDGGSVVDGDGGGDADSDADSDTDTGENETPPVLPEICGIHMAQTPASEEDDWASDAKGDARGPGIHFSGSTLMTWAYFASEDEASWEIRTVPYEPELDGGVVGPAREPSTKGPLAEGPAIAGGGGSFGVAWLDGRWDTNCGPANLSECKKEVAFMEVDKDGLPTAAGEPIQLTLDANVTVPPSIAATTDGYVVLWVEWFGDALRLMARRVDRSGNLDPVQQVSDGGNMGFDGQISAASAGDAVMVAWSGARSDETILARLLNGKGEPQGSAVVVRQGNECRDPTIAPGNSGFLVAWSEKFFDDFEVYTRRIELKEMGLGSINRLTWTTGDARAPSIAYNGSGYGAAWLATTPNGSTKCAIKECIPQVFAGELDGTGVLVSKPVQMSKDVNPCVALDLSWDGGGWTGLWELLRLDRHQIFYGRMVCQDR